MTKTFESLIPSIETRESGWMRIRERLTTARQTPDHPSVTISRQDGCEGYSLGQRLKVLLEEASGQPWTVFDRALVDKVASDESLSRQTPGPLWGMKAMPRMSSGPTSATSPTMTPTPSW